MATFGAAALGFGTLEGWEIQGPTATDEQQRATAPDETGNVEAAQVYDDTQQVTTTYKATAATPALPSSIGADVNGITLTSISVSTDAEDWATMTLTGHAHTDGTHGTCRSVAHGVTLERGFGASAFGITLGVSGEAVRSSEVTISCEHNDVPDATGDTAAGENYNPRIELSGRILGSGATLPAGYDRLEDGTEGSSTDFQYQTLRGIKDLAFT